MALGITTSNVNPSSPQNLLANQHLSEAQKQKEACRQFECILLRQMLQDQMKPMFQGCVPNDNSSDIYQYFVTDTLADSISRSQPFGFANAVEAQIRRGKASQ